MRRPLWHVGMVSAVFVAVGCSEKAEGPPTGPEFHTVLGTVCDPQHISQLATSYFGPGRQQAVKKIVDSLAVFSASSLTKYKTGAKNKGFDVMAQMDSALNFDTPSTAGDPSVGSNLVNHLLLCMYDPTFEAGSYPQTFPESFTVSLTPTTHGTFGERSDTTVRPVFSRPISAPYAGVAPPTSTTQWGNVVTNNPHRVVFYGRPVTTDNAAYEWNSIPRGVGLDPYVNIGFCVNQATDTTAMVLEQGVAVLAFADAYFLDPAAGKCSPSLALGGTSPFQLAQRLLHFGSGLITPRPLMAAVLSPGGVGSKAKCCSKFNPKGVPGVSATLSNVTPNRIKVNATNPGFSITATAMSGNDFVNGTKVTLSTTVNSGTNTFIRVAPSSGPCSAGTVPEGITGTGTNLPGKVVFNNLCFTNTGNVYIIGTFNVEDRKDAPVTAKSNKINVIP